MRCTYAIRNGIVVDPSRGIHETGDLYISGGRMAEPPPGERPEVDEEIDASGCIVTPGLIDFHTHLNYGHSDFGIQPDSMTFPYGVTSAVDPGSTGVANFEGFLRDVAGRSVTTIRSFLNVAAMGVATRIHVEELDPATFQPELLERLFTRYRGQLLGLKLRMGRGFGGEYGLAPLIRTRELADSLRVPMLVHVVDPAQPYRELLPYFRAGDILCHCFQARGEHTVLGEGGSGLRELLEARRRGVLFDAAVGISLHDYGIARAAFAEGFFPDIISTDATINSILSPKMHSLPHALSLFWSLGMPFDEVLRAATEKPAQLMGLRGRIGTLAPGADADIAVLRVDKAPRVFRRYGSESEQAVEAKGLLCPVMTVKAGNVVFRSVDFTV